MAVFPSSNTNHFILSNLETFHILNLKKSTSKWKITQNISAAQSGNSAVINAALALFRGDILLPPPSPCT